MTDNFSGGGQGFGVPAKDLNLPQFIQAMDKAGYLPVDTNALTSAYLTLQAMERAQDGGPVATLLLDGPPGVGKSFLAKSLAAILGGSYLQYNCHPDSSEEELLRDINFFLPMLSQGGFLTKQPDFEDAFIHGQLFDAIRLSHKGPVVLLVDELDKARSAVDALLLGFLNDGYISLPGGDEGFGIKQMKANLQNLIVIITKNDERDLAPALLRRARVVAMDYPPRNVEVRLLQELRGISDGAAKALVTFARKLRANTSLMKPPSPPEVARVAEDFLLLARNNVREGLKDGKNRLECSVPKATLNQYFMNGMLAVPEEHAIGAKTLGDKAPGQALFREILRGMGYQDSLPLAHISEHDLMVGNY